MSAHQIRKELPIEPVENLFGGTIIDMKHHILSALREMFERWEELLANMPEEQIIASLFPSDWSTKDVIAHLMAWQQRSIARVEAAGLDREPVFPQWIADGDVDGDDNVDEINAWIYAAYRDQSWSEVLQGWKAGFLRFLESAEKISERDLLDSGIYPWMNDYPLAFVLLASYNHHQEHLEKLQAWLQEHGDKE